MARIIAGQVASVETRTFYPAAVVTALLACVSSSKPITRLDFTTAQEEVTAAAPTSSLDVEPQEFLRITKRFANPGEPPPALVRLLARFR